MKDFLTPQEEQAVVEEIRAAEAGTSGEIRVAITSRWILRPRKHAEKLFRRLGMAQTRDRNGVLIVLFARRRHFVILGDEGIHHVVAPAYWETVARDMTECLRAGRKVHAITRAVRTLGNTLTGHWPPDDENPDELSNRIHRE